MRKLRACDLFCGAGGTTTGAEASGYADVVLAVNHWRVAVRTHQENHPETRHVCAEIDMVDPRDFLDMGIDVVFASPECIFHSNARGGKPVDDQRRATAWCVPRWAEVLRPKWLVIENVREFKDWGPLVEKRNPAGRIVKHKGETAWVPDKARKGEIFQAWVAAIRGIGYHVEWKILNAADYGGATKRMRLFVVARYGKSTKPIPWPEPTHTPDRYRTARTDVIDWSLPSKSIFDRPKMLSEKTLRRIEIGLRKFNGGRAPYLVDRNWQENRQGRNRVHDVDQPLGTVDGNDRHALATPVISVPAWFTKRIADLRLRFAKSAAMQSLLNTMEELGVYDVLYRMLVNKELARAQGFPDDYLLFGTSSEVTKQIGNSVHTAVACAITRAIGISEQPKKRKAIA